MPTSNNPQSSRKTKLLELVTQDVLEVGPDFNAQSNLFDAGLDSMAIMQLLLLIEQNFGVRLPAAKLTREHFSSVDDLARLMDSETAG
jgi:acyl carrier protein